MKKLLLLLAAVGMLSASLGCAYSAMTSDTNGKVYMTRANLNGLWNSAYVCEPNGGKLNCQEATFEGTGGVAEPEGGEPAPEPVGEGEGEAGEGEAGEGEAGEGEGEGGEGEPVE